MFGLIAEPFGNSFCNRFAEIFAQSWKPGGVAAARKVPLCITACGLAVPRLFVFGGPGERFEGKFDLRLVPAAASEEAAEPQCGEMAGL